MEIKKQLNYQELFSVKFKTEEDIENEKND